MIDAKKFRTIFTEIYNSGEPIINNKTKEVFEAHPNEVFKQCWADTPTRKYFPKYWFVSDLENLLSVKRDKIIWLNKNRRENSNKISYKFAIQTEEGLKIKNIEAHNLVGLVHGAETFGLASELLEEKGLDAFGTNSKEEEHVQGHHKDGDDTNNSPTNIKLVTDTVHVLLENAPTYVDSDEKHFEYMDKLGEVMAKENPKSMTIVLNGDIYNKSTDTWCNDGTSDVFATNKITLSPTATKQLLGVFKLLNKAE